MNLVPSLFALRREDAPAAAAYGLVLDTGAVLLTWAGTWRTIAHYADIGVVDVLHGQQPPPGVSTPRHHRADLADDPAGLQHGRQMLAELLPTLHTTAVEAQHALHTTTPRLVALDRDTDVTGISGAGRVAYGLVLDTGAVLLTWCGALVTLTRYPSLHAVQLLHGHDGATTLHTLDREEHRAGRELLAERLPTLQATIAHARPHLTAGTGR